MYGQIIELVIFAAIAFFIINKLISVLGNTNDGQSNKNSSFFGEPQIKDVSYHDAKSFNKNVGRKSQNNKLIKDIALEGHEQEVEKGLMEAKSKLENLNIVKFLKNSEKAFVAIIEALNKKDKAQIVELVDKRYIEELIQGSSDYSDFNQKSKLQVKISEVYTFGNNVFIKVMFAGKNIFSHNSDFHEEWTFSKNSFDDSPNWYLTNIDKAN